MSGCKKEGEKKKHLLTNCLKKYCDHGGIFPDDWSDFMSTFCDDHVDPHDQEWAKKQMAYLNVEMKKSPEEGYPTWCDTKAAALLDSARLLYAEKKKMWYANHISPATIDAVPLINKHRQKDIRTQKMTEPKAIMMWHIQDGDKDQSSAEWMAEHCITDINA